MSGGRAGEVRRVGESVGEVRRGVHRKDVGGEENLSAIPFRPSPP